MLNSYVVPINDRIQTNNDIIIHSLTVLFDSNVKAFAVSYEPIATKSSLPLNQAIPFAYFSHNCNNKINSSTLHVPYTLRYTTQACFIHQVFLLAFHRM